MSNYFGAISRALTSNAAEAKLPEPSQSTQSTSSKTLESPETEVFSPNLGVREYRAITPKADQTNAEARQSEPFRSPWTTRSWMMSPSTATTSLCLADSEAIRSPRAISYRADESNSEARQPGPYPSPRSTLSRTLPSQTSSSISSLLEASEAGCRVVTPPAEICNAEARQPESSPSPRSTVSRTVAPPTATMISHLEVSPALFQASRLSGHAGVNQVNGDQHVVYEASTA